MTGNRFTSKLRLKKQKLHLEYINLKFKQLKLYCLYLILRNKSVKKKLSVMYLKRKVYLWHWVLPQLRKSCYGCDKRDFILFLIDKFIDFI